MNNQVAIRFLKWLVNTALLLEIVIVIAVSVSLIITISSDDEDLISSWPVTLKAVELNQSPRVNGLNGKLLVNQGELQFSSDSGGYYLLKILDATVLLALVILITVLLRKIITSLSQSQPFQSDNSARLYLMAMAMMFITPFQIVRSYLYQYFIQKNVDIESYQLAVMPFWDKTSASNTLWLEHDFDLLPLFLGLLLLAVAEIFRLGIALKTDNESIV